MNDQLKLKIFDDLVSIVNHDDFDGEIAYRIYRLLAYHGLLNQSNYYTLEPGRLHEMAFEVFEEIGVKAKSL